MSTSGWDRLPFRESQGTVLSTALVTALFGVGLLALILL